MWRKWFEIASASVWRIVLFGHVLKLQTTIHLQNFQSRVKYTVWNCTCFSLHIICTEFQDIHDFLSNKSFSNGLTRSRQWNICDFRTIVRMFRQFSQQLLKRISMLQRYVNESNCWIFWTTVRTMSETVDESVNGPLVTFTKSLLKIKIYHHLSSVAFESTSRW